MMTTVTMYAAYQHKYGAQWTVRSFRFVSRLLQTSAPDFVPTTSTTLIKKGKNEKWGLENDQNQSVECTEV